MLTGRVGRVLGRQMVGLILRLRSHLDVSFTFRLRTMKDQHLDLTVKPKIKDWTMDFPDTDTMTDHDLLVETAVNMRNIIAAIEQLSNSPMTAALMPAPRR